MMNREDSLTYKEISDRLGVSPKTIQYQYMAENSIRFWAGLLSNFFARETVNQYGVLSCFSSHLRNAFKASERIKCSHLIERSS